MSKVVLVALNSSYSHTNLALRYIRQKLVDLDLPNLEIIFFEGTVNDHWLNLFDQLLSFEADVYAFSCYIWNRVLVETLSKHLHQIRPDIAIIWGGPDVSSQADSMLDKFPWLSGLIRSEGDSATVEWICRHLGYADFSTEQLIGETEELSWSFPYTDVELKELNERILYYEGSRGCAYNCTYCLSSNTYRVRHKPLEEVFTELDRILQFNPRQVKFIDRTFNSDPERAFEVWHFLIEKTAELKTRTNFHFEIAAELLNSKQIKLLAKVRPGLFQFEIGAQTTNPNVLRLIRRPYRAEHFRKTVLNLRSLENMHLHLDLIAGLPEENLDSQIQSANDLLTLYPNMMQMGFLKVLPDTQMKVDCDRRNMIYQDFPPYEILQSDAMSAQDLMYYRKLESLVNVYYNSGHYFYSINFLLSLVQKPFSIFILLNDFLKSHLGKGAISGDNQIKLFHQFGLSFLKDLIIERKFQPSSSAKFWLENIKNTSTVFSDLLKVDYFLQGRRGFPTWFTSLHQSSNPGEQRAYSKAISFYRKAGYTDRARFELFSFSLSGLPGFCFAEDVEFSGAGEVQPYPPRVDKYLKAQMQNLDQAESPLYVCAFKLGQGKVKIIKEYQL